MKSLILGMAFLGLVACATAPNKNGLRDVVAPDPGYEPTTLDFEQKLSDSVLPEIKKTFPAAKALELQELVAGIGNKLLSADMYNHPQPYRWNFTVFSGPAKPEVFSLPAGEVFISANLIAHTESEAELAGVISHEIAHVLLKHTTRRIQQIRQVNKNWNMVGGGFIGASMGYGMGKVSEDPSNGADRWAFLLPTTDQELEADSPGLSIAVKAGYDPRYVGRYFQKTLPAKKGNASPQEQARADLLNAFANDKSLKGLVSSGNYEKARQKARSIAKAKG